MEVARDIAKVGDLVIARLHGYMREARITKVTPTFVWLDFTSPSTGVHHNTKHYRDDIYFAEEYRTKFTEKVTPYGVP
jgi:aspartate 1-decarboxylase